MAPRGADQCCVVVFLLCLVGLRGTSASVNEELVEWFKHINDPQFDCAATNFGVEDAPIEQEISDQHIFKVVDCDQEGARWDFKFQAKGSSVEKKKGGGKKLTFSGRSVLAFAQRGGEHGFKQGLRFGKCVALSPEFDGRVNGGRKGGGLRSITGDFEDDGLVPGSRVILEFFDNSFSVAFVADDKRRNHLAGIVRNFKSTGEHGLRMNMTTVNGRTLLYGDKYGLFRLVHSADNRLIFTRDFSSIYNCKAMDSVTFEDCFMIDGTFLDVSKCAVSVNENALCSENRRGGQFLYYAPTDKSFTPGKDQVFELCEESKTFTLEKNVRPSFESWVDAVAKSDVDPFWNVVLPEEEPPLDSSDPLIDIDLPLFRGRRGFELSKQVTIKSIDNTLFKGFMVDGRIEGRVTDDVIGLPDWRAKLTIFLDDPTVAKRKGYFLADGGHEYTAFRVEGRLKRGRLHGPVRMFGQVTVDPMAPCASSIFEEGLSYVGNYEDGVPTGYAWRKLIGGSWLFGKLDSNGEFTGEDIAYIYNDIKTAFVGEFKNGLMGRGKEAEVIGSRCESGIKMFQFSDPSGPDFHYDPSTADNLGDQPLLGDPLDNRYVYLKQSDEIPEAGEGAFAKVDVPPNTAYVLYAGYIWTKEESDRFRKEQDEEFNRRNVSVTAPERIASWKYRHSIRECQLTIDLPGKYEPTSEFRATLGHKVNHKFAPNTFYTHIDSARFGLINGVETHSEAVARDDEFFASYGYGLNINLPWYIEAYKKFSGEHPDLVNEKLLDSLVGTGEDGIGGGVEEKKEEEEAEATNEV